MQIAVTRCWLQVLLAVDERDQAVLGSNVTLLPMVNARTAGQGLTGLR